MNPEDANVETCTVCGKPTNGAAGFAHLYHLGRRFSLCCPMCVEAFQRHRDRFARGERPQSLLDETIAEMKWRDPPY